MRCVVFGAGPAGLASAYALAKAGDRPIVLERSAEVGGISRTIVWKGNRFDLGGHRFFTKFDEVQALWAEVLGDELLVRPRLSRIYYDGKFYDYPLSATNALRNLGVRESARCLASYGRARLRPRGMEESFEAWVSNRFGDRLFDKFFRSYTEKVWGIPTSQIGAEWASQRIKDLDLGAAVRHALGRRRAGITSLIEEFHYPRLGPGQMYERMRDLTVANGGEVRLERGVVRVEHDGGRVQAAIAAGPDGEEVVEGDAFLSSMPLTRLIHALSPAAPDDVRRAADALRFRNLLVVALVVDAPDLFPDNWVYVHDSRLRLGRIQNFKNWSPAMVPDASKTVLGLEYFCDDGDDLWTMSTDALVALAAEELARTGLSRGARVLDGTAVRVPKAYPVYLRGYEAHLARIVAYVKGIENLQPIGRYGMFKYNNADHSILTALLAVENLRGAGHDLWAVNTDTAYHEIRGRT